MKKYKGFTLVEIIIALAVAALMFPALVKLFSFAINASSQGDKYSQAYAIAQEGMEEIYSIKNSDFSALAESTSTIGEFTRKVSVDDVVRNTVDGTLGEGTTIDDGTKKVTVEVSWQETGGMEEVSLSSYVTKY